VRLVAIVQHKQRKGHGLRLNNFIETEDKNGDPAEIAALARKAVKMEKAIGG
jgi:hypothetical protein